MAIIELPQREYEELKRKAMEYDRLTAQRSQGGKLSSNSLSPEQRRERAKKAVAARIAKYGQRQRKQS